MMACAICFSFSIKTSDVAYCAKNVKKKQTTKGTLKFKVMAVTLVKLGKDQDVLIFLEWHNYERKCDTTVSLPKH